MKWHVVKVGPGPREPAIRDPPQGLKVRPGLPLKFISGIPGPPSSLKVRKYMFAMIPTKEYRKNLKKTFIFTH